MNDVAHDEQDGRHASGPLGFSGRVARRFLTSPLSPLIALAALLTGVFAVLVTPREEEPQIDVTFANVFIPFPGASAAQVESLVSSPMEQVLGEISGVEHIYSASRPGLAILSVQFKVGEARTEAIVRLYNAIYSNQDWRPANAGILLPLVKPKGIDDVPIVTLTLWTQDPARGPMSSGRSQDRLRLKSSACPARATFTRSAARKASFAFSSTHRGSQASDLRWRTSPERCLQRTSCSVPEPWRAAIA